MIDVKRETSKFVDFVSEIKELYPQTELGEMPLGLREGKVEIAEPVVRDGWNAVGSNYLHLETPQTFKTTMHMLLESIEAPRENERWLSVGAGPGLYEIFLAQFFSNVDITSTDIAPSMVNIQNDILVQFPELSDRIHPLVDSMTNISQPDHSFDKVFCINSIHWVQDWPKAVAEVDRCLSDQRDSQALFVLATGSVLREGEKYSFGCSDDDLCDAIESHTLELQRVGWLKLSGAQIGATERFFALARRKTNKYGRWNERIERGKLPLVDYVHTMGMVEVNQRRIRR